ncbi:ATP-binding protein [Puia sp.]|jgi:signal transduction histidine kinase/ActR/RegA family two-component response regulator|uniref:ATP-binding protein n=1 Tax=Puia sp. TaxID=2045100 RepID=UPI002F3E58D8
MTSNRIIYLLLCAFIAGNLLVIFMQYNSSRNIQLLITGNKQLLNEMRSGNRLRELEQDLLSSEIRIGRAVLTNDSIPLVQAESLLAEALTLLDSLRITYNQDSTLRNINRLATLADEKSAMINQILDSFRHKAKVTPESYRTIMQHRLFFADVNETSRRIYASRQRLLDSISNSIDESGSQAENWSIVMIMIVLVSGAVLFWYIISRIRQQNLLIQRLDSSEKKVREVSMIKENFMANMSHEIRTPMNAILGFTNLLKSKTRDPELIEFVDAIRQSGDNLLTIINDILDLSKIEAGMMRIESAPFSVRGLLHSVQTMFAEKMNEKRLLFSCTVDESIPDTLSGDATRLTQILVNVIGNALKFTSEGSIQVKISNRGMTPKRILLGFVIRDTGIGIAKEKVSDIFERFRQAEDSMTRKYGGTGLGLSIVKDLVYLQHGEISVESEPGVGTTFNFTLPYEIAIGPLSGATTSAATESEYPDARHIHILVVEDNETNQNLVKHLLNRWRFSYDIVNNGMEAIKRLQTRRFDLVLMDVQMPMMDGYTATREIRMKLKLDTPVIAMTAHAFAGEREKCLSYGMNDYIAKPISERELFRLIERFTGVNHDYQHIDLRYMHGISEGNKDYEKTVTKQFIEVIPGDIGDLETGLANQDAVALAKVAHIMRSDVAVLGLLDEIQPHLDVLEFEIFDEKRFLDAITAVKRVCLSALKEARDYYASLPA